MKISSYHFSRKAQAMKIYAIFSEGELKKIMVAEDKISAANLAGANYDIYVSELGNFEDEVENGYTLNREELYEEEQEKLSRAIAEIQREQEEYEETLKEAMKEESEMEEEAFQQIVGECRMNGIDGEGIELMKQNRITGGTAWREAAENNDMFRRMAIAKYRHEDTFYDQIDKRGRSEEEIADFRRGMNIR